MILYLSPQTYTLPRALNNFNARKINYTEKVLKKSQALKAKPLLYCSVPNRRSISEIIFRLIPFAIVYPIAILYLIFIVSLKYRNTKGAKDLQEKCGCQGVHNRATNHNLFVAGSSGMGKTTIMCYMIGLFPNSARTIFSFKANDYYPSSEYQ